MPVPFWNLLCRNMIHSARKVHRNIEGCNNCNLVLCSYNPPHPSPSCFRCHGLLDHGLCKVSRTAVPSIPETVVDPGLGDPWYGCTSPPFWFLLVVEPGPREGCDTPWWPGNSCPAPAPQDTFPFYLAYHSLMELLWCLGSLPQGPRVSPHSF